MGGFAMKTGFLKLPLSVQGIVIMVVWSVVSAIYIWYNWPVNKFDFVPAFLPVFPVLISSRSGVVITNWQPCMAIIVGLTSWYLIRQTRMQKTKSPLFIRLIRHLLPVWLFMGTCFLLLNHWVPQMGLARFSDFEQLVLILAIFSWQIGLFGSVPLLWAINPYKHGWSANKWMWLYLLTAIVALYMLSHLKFTFGGHFMSLVAFSDGAIWATFPFWLGWAVGMLLIGLIWFLARYQYHNENNTQG